MFESKLKASKKIEARKTEEIPSGFDSTGLGLLRALLRTGIGALLSATAAFEWSWGSCSSIEGGVGFVEGGGSPSKRFSAIALSLSLSLSLKL